MVGIFPSICQQYTCWFCDRKYVTMKLCKELFIQSIFTPIFRRCGHFKISEEIDRKANTFYNIFYFQQIGSVSSRIEKLYHGLSRICEYLSVLHVAMQENGVPKVDSTVGEENQSVNNVVLYLYNCVDNNYRITTLNIRRFRPPISVPPFRM